MVQLQQQIGEDWKEAMKARDPKKEVLGTIKSELKSKAIASREAGSSGTDLKDELALEVLRKMAKQRKEALESFKAGNRQDLVDKETFELAVIESYLPKQLSDSELELLVKNQMVKLGLNTLKDMGQLMKAVLQEAAGRAEGGRVSASVKKNLNAHIG